MHHRLALALVTAFTLAAACNKQAAPTEAPADAAGSADTAASPGSIDDLERQLTRLESELESRKALATTESGGEAAGAGPGDRCQRVCDLREAICGLQEQICGLVADHEDEPRYADACTRATDDCVRATEACSGCSA